MGVGWWGCVRTGPIREQESSTAQLAQESLLQGLSGLGHLHCPNGVKTMRQGSCFSYQSPGHQTVELSYYSHILYPSLDSFLLCFPNNSGLSAL